MRFCFIFVLLKIKLKEMDLVDNSTYLIEKVVQEVKSQGLFDQFRKECISDVDTSKLTFFSFHFQINLQ